MKSKCLFISNVLLTLYSIFLYLTFYGTSADGAEALAKGIASVILMPHLLGVFVGTALGWIAFSRAKSGPAFAAAILMLVGTILTFGDFQVIGIVLTICAFIGAFRQGKRD